MSQTWHGAEPPDWPAPGAMGWLRAVLRGLPLAVLVFGGLALLLAMRLVERPLCGLARPVTPYVTQAVCRAALWLMGIGFRREGTILPGHVALVANHASWIDIFALNACTRLYFVSKSEVAGWPGIGWLARATGTVFIDRDRAQARAHTDLLADRLAAGHRLMFFPEGTSTDGRRVLSFKPTLFAALYEDRIAHDVEAQALTVIYAAPPGADPRFYGWWGDMSFGGHLVHVLSAPRQGRVTVVAHAPVRVDAFAHRKALAAHLEHQTRETLQTRLG
jgi:1-acyl-sn-glycerol-3-phosphate acyltransferase